MQNFRKLTKNNTKKIKSINLYKFYKIISLFFLILKGKKFQMC